MAKDNPNQQDADIGYQEMNVYESNDQCSLTPQMEQYLQDHKKKKAIVLTARVHPGESNSSFIIEGIIKFILSNSKEAKLLRQNYIFKIIPMLNPDGVIFGNYRCSMLGVDLNRRWINPSKILHPTIFYTKQVIKMLDIERSVELFTDIHGHSRKFNIFIYGCCLTQNSSSETVSKSPSVAQHKNNALIKVLPLVMDKKIEHFSFKDCRFAMEKEKESTARVVIFKELSILHSYTLEASFYGSEIIEYEDVQELITDHEMEEDDEENKIDINEQIQEFEGQQNKIDRHEKSSKNSTPKSKVFSQDLISVELQSPTNEIQQSQTEINDLDIKHEAQEITHVQNESQHQQEIVKECQYRTIQVENRRKIVYTTDKLVKFGEDFCKQILILINPIQLRRHVNLILNTNRKRKSPKPRNKQGHHAQSTNDLNLHIEGLIGTISQRNGSQLNQQSTQQNTLAKQIPSNFQNMDNETISEQKNLKQSSPRGQNHILNQVISPKKNKGVSEFMREKQLIALSKRVRIRNNQSFDQQCLHESQNQTTSNNENHVIEYNRYSPEYKTKQYITSNQQIGKEGLEKAATRFSEDYSDDYNSNVEIIYPQMDLGSEQIRLPLQLRNSIKVEHIQTQQPQTIINTQHNHEQLQILQSNQRQFTDKKTEHKHIQKRSNVNYRSVQIKNQFGDVISQLNDKISLVQNLLNTNSNASHLKFQDQKYQDYSLQSSITENFASNNDNGDYDFYQEYNNIQKNNSFKMPRKHETYSDTNSLGNNSRPNLNNNNQMVGNQASIISASLQNDSIQIQAIRQREKQLEARIKQLTQNHKSIFHSKPPSISQKLNQSYDTNNPRMSLQQQILFEPNAPSLSTNKQTQGTILRQSAASQNNKSPCQKNTIKLSSWDQKLIIEKPQLMSRMSNQFQTDFNQYQRVRPIPQQLKQIQNQKSQIKLPSISDFNSNMAYINQSQAENKEQSFLSSNNKNISRDASNDYLIGIDQQQHHLQQRQLRGGGEIGRVNLNDMLQRKITDKSIEVVKNKRWKPKR